MLQALKKLNPHLSLYSVNDVQFSEFGRVITGTDISMLTEKAKQIPFPKEGSSYEASVPEFETCPEKDVLQNELFGEIAIEIGYCWGYSSQLNALEWHKSSEINIAVTPMILLVGRLQNYKDGIYHSENVMAFYLEVGQVVEMYATTLHYCPCQTDENGFGCIVILPKGTNTPLENKSKNPLLFRQNKWIIAHYENEALIQRGVVPGIDGINYCVNVK